jgi:hypothetical protein
MLVEKMDGVPFYSSGFDLGAGGLQSGADAAGQIFGVHRFVEAAKVFEHV